MTAEQQRGMTRQYGVLELGFARRRRGRAAAGSI